MSLKRQKQSQKLEKEDFIEYYGNLSYYRKILGIHHEYELVLDPCNRGFAVTLYRRQFDNSQKRIIRVCTDVTPDGDSEWIAALDIANQLVDQRLPKGIERL